MNAESDPEPDSPPSTQASPKKFMSAYEEKKMMRERAAAESSNATAAVPVPQTNTSPPRSAAWPSAEDEKQRLYESAKQQALKTQAIMSTGAVPMVSCVRF